MAATAPRAGGLRVAFAGTPEFAACALEAILAAGYDVPLVLTQPDRPAGRGMKLTPSAVKKLALERGIAVDQPEKLRTEEQRARLAECAPDVLVVAAYGLILPRSVLELPRLGCLNIHASLLPRWRGAAPIHRAIEAGDAETGITIMQMDAGLDTGDMLLIEREAIRPDDTTAVLHDRLARLGGRLIVEALEMAACGGLTRTPQPESGITYAHKIEKAEAAIDWSLSADVIARRVRAFDPFPGCTFTLSGDKGPETHKVWAAQAVSDQGAPGQVLQAQGDTLVVACGEGALALHMLQKPGGKRVRAREFLQSTALPAQLT
jgi:methionyl-tRNA formyltransferase